MIYKLLQKQHNYVCAVPSRRQANFAYNLLRNAHKLSKPQQRDTAFRLIQRFSRFAEEACGCTATASASTSC